MSKLNLTDIGNLLDTTTSKTTINNNSAAIETAFENTLSRDGTSPNSMNSPLDMNDNQIINLPQPFTVNSPLRLQDLSDFIGSGTISNIPSGGANNDILVKESNANYDVGWESIGSILSTGGATGTGQIVLSNSPTLTGTVTVNGSIVDVGGNLTAPSVNYSGSTSGITQLKANAVASGVVTLPAATDTLVGKATTDTLTNKTYDTAGAGNSFSINGVAANANTGTGAVVRATTPTLVTPVLGVATATSINKVAFTAPASSATLTIPDGVTLTGPAASGTAMTLGNTETVTGVKTFGSAGAVGRLKVAGTTSGSTVIDATAVASGTLTLPAATDTLVGKATTDTLTNKTLTTPVINGTITGTTVIPIANGGTGTANGPVVTVKKQVFTANGTYTPSTGMIFCMIECVGGGGGGGGVAGAAGFMFCGGGGGSGSYSRLLATAATIGASKAVTIGTAGAGGTAGFNSGSAGGDTSVGAICIGKGGSGGAGSNSGSAGVAGLGGVAGTGDFTPTGVPGNGALYYASSAILVLNYAAGSGGSSIFGGGATGQAGNANSVAGNNATNYGSGGGGAGSQNSATNAAGGNGSAGVVFITEYCTQ